MHMTLVSADQKIFFSVYIVLPLPSSLSPSLYPYFFIGIHQQRCHPGQQQSAYVLRTLLKHDSEFRG